MRILSSYTSTRKKAGFEFAVGVETSTVGNRTLFSRSHGYGDNSDVELWVSTDGGVNWKFRSKVSSHPEEPDGIRMNHVVGLNGEGHLVALVSGYHKGQKLPLLKLQRCISKDSGRTWDRQLLDLDVVPHGDIFALPDGRLVCPAYRKLPGEGRRREASVIFSSATALPR